MKERERQREEAEKEKLRAADQARSDKALLASYGHEDDIIFVRDRKLAQIETSIKATEQTLKSLVAVHARLEKQAADESRGGKSPSDTTKANLAQTEGQIKRHEATIATKRKEQEDIRTQFAADLERYRELRRQGSVKKTTSKAGSGNSAN